MCQDNIQNENSLWEKRNSPRPDSGGVMWRDLSLDLGSLVLPFFAPFTQYIIIIHIHEMTHPRQSIVSQKISSTIWVKKLI